MRTIAYTIAIGAVFLIAGCKDNPVAPSSPAPLSADAQLSATALTLFSQGKDVVTAATVLNSEYRLGTDALTSALYNAGYTPQDLARALNVVFKESPRGCEAVMLRIAFMEGLLSMGLLLIKFVNESTHTCAKPPSTKSSAPVT